MRSTRVFIVFAMIACFAAGGLLVYVADAQVRPDPKDTAAARQIEEAYQLINDATRKQREAYQKKLDEDSDRGKRVDALLTRWEEQTAKSEKVAERYTKILGYLGEAAAADAEAAGFDGGEEVNGSKQKGGCHAIDGSGHVGRATAWGRGILRLWISGHARAHERQRAGLADRIRRRWNCVAGGRSLDCSDCEKLRKPNRKIISQARAAADLRGGLW